ncbi:MAG: YjbQ family protein [Thermoplasmatales archaeon]|nr:MAG: YjbQ family protein [Thermoplasmatales archaeon]
MREIKVISKKRNEMIDITSDVQEIVDEEDINNGLAVIYVPHTTAGITINEGADPSVQRDIIETLKRMVPESGDYHHMEGNSDAHIKASLMGSSVTVIIENRRLVLGTWQHIFFFEGDGPRNRKVYLSFVKN